jgi:osmoprotectant transport system substrate-binding protein
MRRCGSIVLLAVTLSVLLGCGATNPEPRLDPSTDGVITVGSFDFAESRLLAEIYSQALEAGGHRVERAFDLGPREFVAPALAGGLVELVPEYAGTALQFASLGADVPTADVVRTHGALARALRSREVSALHSAPAQDANTFVVPRETAERYGLSSLSDLAAVSSQLIFGGPPECPSRPLCLIGLRERYGVEFEEFVPLDAGGPLTLEALERGVVDVALLFTTDPAIERADLVELRDDRELQPAENVTPLVRTAIIDRSGQELVAIIDAVSQRLTTDGLRELNAQVASPTSRCARATARDSASSRVTPRSPSRSRPRSSPRFHVVVG